MNDAHPRWQYTEGGPDNGRDPDAQDPYTQQEPNGRQQDQGYGHDPYAQQGHVNQYDQYDGQQQGWIPQQAQPEQYAQQPQEQSYAYPQQSQEPQQYAQQQYAQQQYAQQQYAQQQYTDQQYTDQQYVEPHYVDPQYQQEYGEPQDRPAEQYQDPVPEPGRAQDPEDPEDPEDYRTEQFAFVDEDDEESEEVIDWLKFSESRTERRDERKRRGRHRVVGLVVAGVLAVVAGTGYLAYSGLLPGMDGAESGPGTAVGERRDVIVVHLRPINSDESSTALLVGNTSTKRGTAVLLPNSLSLNTGEGDLTTLGKSVEDGAGPTRESLGSLLGADIKGTWRLDTPYLELLVEAVGGITLDTDVTVTEDGKADGKVLVEGGKGKELNGQAAVGYAVHRASGEAQAKQLARFGQVVQAVLKKMPSSAKSATTTVRALGAIPDPSLPENELGATLARLSEQAKKGAYDTTLLPVQDDGTLSEEATDDVVKNVLGGTVKNVDTTAAPRVSVKDATGTTDLAGKAQVALVNSGYNFVSAGRTDEQGTSRVTYTEDARKEAAVQTAKTLGLPESAVTKEKDASNVDITVVLGQDFKPDGD